MKTKSSRVGSIKRRPFLLTLGAILACGRRAVADVVAPTFKVTLSEAHKGTLEIDTRLLDSYGELPANVRQFYLDARAVFEADRQADFSDRAIVEAARKHGLALMGGPTLGDLRKDGVTLWLRPATEARLTVHVGDRSYPVQSSGPGVAAWVKIDGLSPATRYRYEILQDRRTIAEGRFTTAPDETDQGEFRISFGSCCHKIGVHNPNLFRQILRRKPSAMLLLGDTAVDDRNNRVSMHRSDYQLRDVSKAWRELVSHVPVFASWDDHDYFDNDLSGIPRGFTAEDRDAVRAVWHQNWNNPLADDGREGIYFNTRLGPVEVIMLDTRSCRDNRRRNEYGSYLGERQMNWLKRTLKQSTAPFKVVSSGTMWSDYVSNAKDSWGSWDTEGREEIFNLIEQEHIGGVLLISGDRHGARGFRIPRPSGFAFYEFEAASLGGVPGPSGIVDDCPQQLFGYDGKDLIAFGEFTFDTSGSEPKVTFRLISQHGEIMEEHPLSLRELTHARSQE